MEKKLSKNILKNFEKFRKIFSFFSRWKIWRFLKFLDFFCLRSFENIFVIFDYFRKKSKKSKNLKNISDFEKNENIFRKFSKFFKVFFDNYFFKSCLTSARIILSSFPINMRIKPPVRIKLLFFFQYSSPLSLISIIRWEIFWPARRTVGLHPLAAI